MAIHLTDKLDERTDNAIEPSRKLARQLLDVSHGDSNLEAREHLSSRAKRRVIARLPQLAARVHALAKIERNARNRAPQLPPDRDRPD